MSLGNILGNVVKAAQQQQTEILEQAAQERKTKLTDEEMFKAWEILSPAGRSVLTKSQLLENLQLFFPHISAKEVKDLVGPGNMSVDKLRDLLTSVDAPPDVDASQEAFQILDPHGTGYVEMNVLRKLLLQLPGVGTLDKADMDLLESLADSDKDGRMSFKDFSNLGSWSQSKEDALTPRASTK